LTNFISTVNNWSQKRIPFLFLIDFELQKPLAIKLSDVNPAEILYEVNGFTNAGCSGNFEKESLEFKKNPISLTDYQLKFSKVMRALRQGDSYLANLTIQTPIQINRTLQDLFFQAKAKYKLCYRNQFLVFSPESFIKIQNGIISSFPMKGTIDASLPNAKEIILDNPKEKSEHVTIVDLIRNDLSLVATDVTVSRFRYVEELKTTDRNLLQVSSEITGKLNTDFSFGNLLMGLLPAGSISGAPKRKTVEIIRDAEGELRGYFTGVFGIFDGINVDSGVMIRYIENTPNGFVYRSGGGITAQSDLVQEYQEAIDKVYAPVY
jgi:para-aminobenzoate synthetase component 1